MFLKGDIYHHHFIFEVLRFFLELRKEKEGTKW